jgi:hypothetical protein
MSAETFHKLWVAFLADPFPFIVLIGVVFWAGWAFCRRRDKRQLDINEERIRHWQALMDQMRDKEERLNAELAATKDEIQVLTVLIESPLSQPAEIAASLKSTNEAVERAKVANTAVMDAMREVGWPTDTPLGTPHTLTHPSKLGPPP